MSTNFRDAVKFAQSKLEEYREVDYISVIENYNKTFSLGIYDESTNWDLEIEKAKENYESFVKVKRYCARLIRIGKLEQKFEDWLIDYLDGVFQPPRNSKRGTPKKHNEFDVLALLINLLCEKFELSPTRGRESAEVSACDALSQAIITVNRETEYKDPIEITSYDGLEKHYSAAKKRGDF